MSEKNRSSGSDDIEKIGSIDGLRFVFDSAGIPEDPHLDPMSSDVKRFGVIMENQAFLVVQRASSETPAYRLLPLLADVSRISAEDRLMLESHCPPLRLASLSEAFKNLLDQHNISLPTLRWSRASRSHIREGKIQHRLNMSKLFGNEEPK